MRRAALAIALGLSQIISSSVRGQMAPPEATSDVVPGAEWQLVKPESVGFSNSRLEAVRGWITTDQTSAMMVIVRGRLIFSYGDISHSSRVFSVRKSVLGMLYGNYVASGKIDLTKTVKQIGITDKKPLLPIEETATLQQLLASRSGVYIPTGSFGQSDYMPKRGSQDPGHFHVYNNWDFDAAGVAFEKLTGRSIYEAIQTDLATPLGMQDYRAAEQKKEFSPESGLGEYAMSLSARDMARLGLLMLDRGRWNGKQVIPSDWVRYQTTLVTPHRDVHPNYFPDPDDPRLWGYGYLWWVWDDQAGPGDVYSTIFQGMYTAMGTGGNYITVIPSENMVVIHQVDLTGRPKAWVSTSSYMAILAMLANSYCGTHCK